MERIFIKPFRLDGLIEPSEVGWDMFTYHSTRRRLLLRARYTTVFCIRDDHAVLEYPCRAVVEC